MARPALTRPMPTCSWLLASFALPIHRLLSLSLPSSLPFSAAVSSPINNLHQLYPHLVCISFPRSLGHLGLKWHHLWVPQALRPCKTCLPEGPQHAPPVICAVWPLLTSLHETHPGHTALPVLLTPSCTVLCHIRQFLIPCPTVSHIVYRWLHPRAKPHQGQGLAAGPTCSFRLWCS